MILGKIFRRQRRNIGHLLKEVKFYESFLWAYDHSAHRNVSILQIVDIPARLKKHVVDFLHGISEREGILLLFSDVPESL
ncbi:MAG: hypothetical protein ABSA46_16655 [Thermodesulfovibrionales bacterium]